MLICRLYRRGWKLFVVFIPLWMLKFSGHTALGLIYIHNSTIRLFLLCQNDCTAFMYWRERHIRDFSSWLLNVLPFRHYSENQKPRTCQNIKPNRWPNTGECWNWRCIISFINQQCKCLEAACWRRGSFFCTLSLTIRIFTIIYVVLQPFYAEWCSPESWSSLLTSPLAENNRDFRAYQVLR